MAILLTGPQSLFVRLGRIFAAAGAANVSRGSAMPAAVDLIRAEFSSTDQATADGLYAALSSYQSGMNSFQSAMSALASATLLNMANDDAPLPSKASVPQALDRLIAQMIGTSQTVHSSAVSAAITQGAGNVGTPVLVASPVGTDGIVRELCFNELISGTCTDDSSSGVVPAFRERLRFLGQYGVSDAMSHLYPVGSGAVRTVTLVDSSLSSLGGNQNYLSNSTFDVWTPGPGPAGWVVTGSSYSQVAAPEPGTSAFSFTGNGTENTSIYQEFFNTSGTAVGPNPSAVMAFNALVACPATPPSGVLEFALVDGAGAVVNDAAGTPNLVAVAASSLGPSWSYVAGFFRTPRVLPSPLRFRVRLSTPLPAGYTLLVDKMALTTPYELYPGGPFLAAFSGRTAPVSGDSYSLAASNDYAGKFQWMFNRAFGTRALGKQLPSSASPTIPDSLIS